MIILPRPKGLEVAGQHVSDQVLVARRLRMVEDQIARRGVTDPAVLEAMRRVPRHLFVPSDMVESAYDDTPLPIGWGQTISQPYIVASMTEQIGLTSGSKVLEIGTGSGYQTAVLAEIARVVYSIELISGLADRAESILDNLYPETVKLRNGDGNDGWPEEAPFDAIMVTAAADEIPSKLLNQLNVNGRMIIPVRLEKSDSQELVLATRSRSGFSYESLYQVRFVPLKRGL